jgi:sugar phosphate isomerase/epimerase
MLFLEPSELFKKDRLIGVQLYTVRNEIFKDPKATLAKIAAIGYKSVETFGYGNGKWYGLNAQAFGEELKKNGLVSPSGHTSPGSMFLKEGWESGWQKTVEDAKAIGQEYVVIPYLEEPHRKSLDNFRKIAQGLNKAAETAKAAGLKLAYHNHDFEFDPLDGSSGFEILLTETDPKLVNFELDLYWVSKAGKKPLELFKQHAGRFPMWHVKDMDNTEKKFFTEVGNGTINFKEIFSKARQSGMKYFFVEQDVCPGSPLDSIEKSYNYLKNNL